MRAASAEGALALLVRDEVDIAIVDVHQPGISGFELLRILRENYPTAEVIMTSATADVGSAVQAVKLGAFHFVTKDVRREEIRALVGHALERQDLSRQVLRLQTRGRRVHGSRVRRRAQPEHARDPRSRAARREALGHGPHPRRERHGQGAARALIHRGSERPDGPFVAVNLAAIPRELVESVLFGHEKGSFTGAIRQQIGKFELASGGTLFLDEIGDLRPELQAKLLRAIQEGEVERIGSARPVKTDFRLIAATHVDLDKAMKDGRFREDLFYRLNVVRLKVPPLRERIGRHPRARAVLPAALQHAVPQADAGHLGGRCSARCRPTGGRATSASSRT